jgi:hypothetical protein
MVFIGCIVGTGHLGRNEAVPGPRADKAPTRNRPPRLSASGCGGTLRVFPPFS